MGARGPVPAHGHPLQQTQSAGAGAYAQTRDSQAQSPRHESDLPPSDRSERERTQHAPPSTGADPPPVQGVQQKLLLTHPMQVSAVHLASPPYLCAHFTPLTHSLPVVAAQVPPRLLRLPRHPPTHRVQSCPQPHPESLRRGRTRATAARRAAYTGGAPAQSTNRPTHICKELTHLNPHPNATHRRSLGGRSRGPPGPGGGCTRRQRHPRRRKTDVRRPKREVSSCPAQR